MRIFLLLPLLLAFVWPGQNGVISRDGSPVLVIGFQWSKSRRKIPRRDTSRVPPAAALTQADKIMSGTGVNEQAGVRHPNADTIDARSAAMEKIVQEARAEKTVTVDGHAYQVKVRNASAKVIEVLFWNINSSSRRIRQT